MAIYLGNAGNIELTRQSLETSRDSVVNPGDVNATLNRFSFDFDEGFLVSGDFVELTTTDGTDLDFIDSTGWLNNTVQNSGNWYVFIDDVGGIKLYNTFDNSVAGGVTGIVDLVAIDRDIPIRVVVRSRDARLLACITDYELNTNREAVDVTALSDQHRQQYSGLISGSGRLTAQWDYVSPSNQETVHYLMQLVLRTEIGSSFNAKFYIKSSGVDPAAGTFSPGQTNDALWWEFNGVVTSSATSFAPGSIVVSSIDFITTGPIAIRTRTQAEGDLLLENGDLLVLEQNNAAPLLLDIAPD
jgi:hypothetical protein